MSAVHENFFMQWRNNFQHLNAKNQFEVEVQKFENTEDG